MNQRAVLVRRCLSTSGGIGRRGPVDAHEELCQACHRINDRYPAGVVTLTGSIVQQNKADIIGLLHRQEQAEKKDHPLNRIISVEETDFRDAEVFAEAVQRPIMKSVATKTLACPSVLPVSRYPPAQCSLGRW
jgi:hypothetical protein